MIVSVGVIVGPDGRGVKVQVAVAEGVKVGEGEGVKVGVRVWLGVMDGVAVGCRLPATEVLAAGTVGKATRVGVGVLVAGHGMAVGEVVAKDAGVGLGLQPIKRLSRHSKTRRVRMLFSYTEMAKDGFQQVLTGGLTGNLAQGMDRCGQVNRHQIGRDSLLVGCLGRTNMIQSAA